MKLDTLQFRHLKAFEITAEHLHFRKAAEALNYTQPSLSRLIKELEDILGFKLFERHTRTVTLLPQGAVLRDHLPRIYEQLNIAFKRAESTATGKAGLLRVGVIGTPVMSYLHEPLMHFKKAYPDYEVSLEEGSSIEIAQKLAEGWLECGFYLSSVSHPKVIEKVISKDHLYFSVSINHPFSRKRALELSDLENEKIILFPASRNPNLFNQIVNGIPRFSKSNLIEASSRQMAVLMAAANFGIATIGESMVQSCPPSVKCLPLKGESIGVDIVMGWPRGRSNPLEAFLPKTLSKAKKS